MTMADVRQHTAADHTFTRLTVSTPNRPVDVAVPDDMPVAEVISAILLEVGSTGEAMVLEHPVKGTAPAEATMGSLGVLDGEHLTLRPVHESERVRPVDDVAESVAAGTDAAAPWGPSTGHTAFAAVLAAWSVAGAMLSDIVRPVSMRPYVLAVCLLVLLVGQLLARGSGRDREKDLLAATTIPVAAFTGWVLVHQLRPGLLDQVIAAALAALFAVTATALVEPRHARWVRPTGLALAAAAPAAVIARVAPLVGWSPAITAAVVAVITALGLGLVTKAALSTSGLLRLDTDSAEGRPVTAGDLTASAGRAAHDVTAMLLGLCVGGCGAVIVLAQQGLWGVLLGLTLAIVMASRARSFWRREHIVVLVVAPLVALGGAALLAAATTPSTPLAAVILAGAVPLGLLMAFETRTIAQARFKVWLDRLETVALIALVPLALAVADLYVQVYERFN